MLAEKPAIEVRVDNLGRFLDRIFFGGVRFDADGRFLANTFHHIWHWNTNGDLINLIGGRGEGPGEFSSISQVIFTGEYYWVIDGSRMLSSIFDFQGRFLFRQATPFRQLIPVGEQLFVVDYSRLNPHLRNYPTVVQEVKYFIGSSNLQIQNTDLRFKKVSPRQWDFGLNFKLLWLVKSGEGWLVAEQTEPKILIYDAAALKAEKSLSDNQSFQPRSIPIRVPGWVSAPARMVPNLGNREGRLRWWRSWSRITYFDRLEAGFAVAYEVPDERDPRGLLTAVVRLSKDGEAIGKPLLLKGMCVGFREKMVYVFHADETKDEFKYYIRAYRL